MYIYIYIYLTPKLNPQVEQRGGWRAPDVGHQPASFQDGAGDHARPFPGVSQVCSWSHWLVLGAGFN